MNNDEELIELDIEDDNLDPPIINKKEVLNFLENLNEMPQIDIEKVYQSIVNDEVNLPKFSVDRHYLYLCKYIDKQNQKIFIMHDLGSDNYYYICNEKVFSVDIYQSRNNFYSKVAEQTKRDIVDVHDYYIDKIGFYESLFLIKDSKFIGELQTFIDKNIYLFDNILKSKEPNNKNKLKI